MARSERASTGHPHVETVKRVAPDLSQSLNTDGAGSRFACPSCGLANTLGYRDGRPLCGCFRCGLGYVYALGVTEAELLADPWCYLEAYSTGQRPHERQPDPVPTEARVAGWASRLMAEPDRLRELEQERGLTLETIRDYELGWDEVRRGITLPIRNDAGELVNLSWRAPRGHRLMLPGGRPRSKHRIAGRTAELGHLPLYPDVPPFGSILLCEGEMDALLARQHGLPACTGLLGKQWHRAWNPLAAGRRIGVMYDLGAEEDAAKTVERLLAAGAAEAWVVPLPMPMHGEDVSDWFLRYGRTADELRALANRARRQ